MRTWIKLTALACAFGLAGPASADDDKSRSDKTLTDSHFVDHAYTCGQNELLLSRLAQQRSQNAEVRQFAAKLMEEHAKANQDLILIVSEYRIAVPEKPLPEQEKAIQHLHTDAVKNFDQEYLDHMIKDHEAAVKLYERASKDLKNEKLKAYAAKTLPALKDHLKMAKEVRSKVKGDAAGATRSADPTTRVEPDRRSAAKGMSDNDFVMKAASSGMAEVAIGKIGQEKAKNAEVKKFADRVVTDHTKANEKLMSAAKDAGLSPPDKPAADQAEKVKHFDHANADNFDREFVKHMVESHTKGVELYTKASKELKNEKLRSFAESTLPTLKEHLNLAKQLQERVRRD